MTRIVAAILCFSFCAGLSAQTAAPDAAAPAATAPVQFPEYTMMEGKRDRMNLSTSAASLCVLPEKKICYAMPAQPANLADPATSGKDLWQFGLSPHSERYTVPGSSLVLFTAAYYGGAETLKSLALLAYADGKFTDLLPFIGVTELGEYAMWDIPQISPYPILVVADYPHDVTVTLGEDDPPRVPVHFTVTVWKFDPAASVYKQAYTYQTTRLYRGGKRINNVGVLGPERDEMLRRLMVQRTADAPSAQKPK